MLGYGSDNMCDHQRRGAGTAANIVEDRNRPQKHVERAGIVLARPIGDQRSRLPSALIFLQKSGQG